MIFELDVYLRHMKFFRFLSFSVAFLWNFFYFFTVGVFIYQIYNPPEWRDYDLVNAFAMCLVGYNLIFDALALPVNTVIIVKELSMEFFQMLKHNAGEESDDVSLGLMDIADALVTISFFLNPFNIATFIWQLVMGRVDFGEIAAEHPGENEQDYYKLSNFDGR